jgi:hypothetical protein
MVCHLSGTGNFGPLSKRSFDAMMEWHERDRRGEIKKESTGRDTFGVPGFRITDKKDNPPDEILADAKELFKRLYNKSMRLEGGAGAVLTNPDTHRASFIRLHRLRNDFVHFTPKGWSIEVSGMPQMFLHIIDVLDQIVEDPWPFRHCDDEEEARLRGLLDLLKTELKKPEFQ